MADGAEGDAAWFSVESDGGNTTDVTLQVYASAGVGALILGAIFWWWTPTGFVWLDVGIGLLLGAFVGYVGWGLWRRARNGVRHRRMVRLAKDDPEEFRRRYGPPSA
jgi:divalent metal cation (Fe/Co/Zn/Cd) transporter